MSASQQTVGGEVSLTRNERLDRLPFNKAHRKLLVASGIGWAFDAMDVGLVSFVVAAIAADPHFNLTPTEKSWVLSIGFVGMAIGAALGGFVADRVGRKTVFSATLVIFGLANGGMALSWSLAALLIARLVIGLGLGAELPVASTLVSEFSPTKQRGRMTVLLESFWAIGWIIAACIGYFVIPNTGDWGWRWALLIGALPLLYAIVTRIHIPESVRFLESKGREDEAEQAVRYMGPRGRADERVFSGLKYSAWHNLALREWCMKAGITKHITFHCGRHTFAVLQRSLSTARSTTPSSFRPPLPIPPLCSTSRLWPVPLSASSSCTTARTASPLARPTPAATCSSSTMTCPSRPWPTVRCR